MTIIYRSGESMVSIDLTEEEAFTLAGNSGPVRFYQDAGKAFIAYRGLYGERRKQIVGNWTEVGGGYAAIAETEMEVA